MEILKNPFPDGVELIVSGRMDGYWSEHLAQEIDGVLRDGMHRIKLNLANVSFLSSAGIRILIKYLNQLKEMNGSFSISVSSEPVQKVLKLVGIWDLLVQEKPTPKTDAKDSGPYQIENEHINLEIFTVGHGAALRCRTVGSPELLSASSMPKAEVHPVIFPKTAFGLGLGAFGSSAAECRNRFGEFLAAAGAAVYLPTDGSNVPDYMLTSGTMVPELQALYAVVCEGEFSHLVRFEAKKETGSVPLTKMAEACMEITKASRLGMVMVAESEGLVGAALRRSPVDRKANEVPLDHPEIREWFTFTSERAYERNLVMVVGIVMSSGKVDGLKPYVRPMGKNTLLSGHFHASIFPYSLLKKGLISLESTVEVLFNTRTIESMLHLLNDDREFGGAGQSEFIRGACWIASIEY